MVPDCKVFCRLNCVECLILSNAEYVFGFSEITSKGKDLPIFKLSVYGKLIDNCEQ